MRVHDTTKPFEYTRLQQDLESLGIPTDFSIIISDEIGSYWGLYYPAKKLIKSYVSGLSYETAFPHILHESLHHYQHQHQHGFKRSKGVMHDSFFTELYESKLNEWVLLYKDRR